MPFPLSDATLSGTLAPDGGYFGGGELSGVLDARDMGPLMVDYLDDTSPAEVCKLLTAFGVDCGTCDDGKPYCIDVLIDHLIAEQHGAELELIEQENCHPQCAASCDNTACSKAAGFAICNGERLEQGRLPGTSLKALPLHSSAQREAHPIHRARCQARRDPRRAPAGRAVRCRRAPGGSSRCRG